jgi:prevent-host-death family protein
MERIGVRELRQHASRWLARVAAGETIEITDRGRPVAMLTPPSQLLVRDRLRLEGRLIPARHDLRDLVPLPAQTGGRSLTEALADMRNEDR